MKACINNQQIRHYNKGVLLEYLYRKKRASKSTLARLAQISIPAVSNILQELEEEGRVVNVPDDHLSRGHSSGAWLIAPEGDWTLCMNITPTSIECQLGNACLSPKGDVEYHAIDAPIPVHYSRPLRNAGISTVKIGLIEKSIWRWRFMDRLMRERAYRRRCHRRPETARGIEIPAGRKTQRARHGR